MNIPLLYGNNQVQSQASSHKRGYLVGEKSTTYEVHNLSVLFLIP